MQKKFTSVVHNIDLGLRRSLSSGWLEWRLTNSCLCRKNV